MSQQRKKLCCNRAGRDVSPQKTQPHTTKLTCQGKALSNNAMRTTVPTHSVTAFLARTRHGLVRATERLGRTTEAFCCDKEFSIATNLSSSYNR